MTAIIRSRGADVYYFVTHFLRNEWLQYTTF